MKNDELIPRHLDRVRRNTASDVNRKIDRQTKRNIAYYANGSRAELSERIEELEREWDIERCLETAASAFAFSGSILSATISRRFLAIPLVVTGFLFQHGVQGWCPPMPVLRRLGVRTRNEIDVEIYALKALRGDFEGLAQSNSIVDLVDHVVEAVRVKPAHNGNHGAMTSS